MRMVGLAGPGCVLLVALLPAGCGREVALPGELDGARVGLMAEQELEAQNPELTHGTLTCPDLALEVGASVRCLRTADLSGGRVVKIWGTVEVRSLAAGGRLHVAMDDEAEEFGLAGSHVAADLRGRYVRLFGAEPGRVDCPYLRGSVGHRVTCRIDGGDAGRPVKHVQVVVTGTDPDSYRTSYSIRGVRPPS